MRRSGLTNPLYRDGKVKCVINGDFRAHSYVDRKPGKRMVHGIASTPTVNAHKYSLRSSGCQVIFPIPLLVSHKGSNHLKGFGEVTLVRIHDTQVYFMGEIFENEAGDFAWKQITEGKLRAVSGPAAQDGLERSRGA